MNDDMMTTPDFEERAMAYGANFDAWPEEDRAPARALLPVSAAAREALEDARALDAMLDLWEGPQPSNALLSKVLGDAAMVTGERPAAAAATPAREGWLARMLGGASPMRPALALAACLALGFVMGTSLDEQVMAPAEVRAAGDMGMVDFAFAIEDDADMFLGPEALL